MYIPQGCQGYSSQEPGGIDEPGANPHLVVMSDTQFDVTPNAAKRIAFLASKEAKPVMMRVAVLGGGRMGEALVAGLLDAGTGESIEVVEVVDGRRDELAKAFPAIRVVGSPAELTGAPADGRGGDPSQLLGQGRPHIPVTRAVDTDREFDRTSWSLALAGPGLRPDARADRPRSLRTGAEAVAPDLT